MSDQKQLRLFRLLIEKTKGGKLQWAATASDEQFQIALSDYTVTISRFRQADVDAGDEFRIHLYNSRGTLLDSFSNSEVSQELADSEAQREFYRDVAQLYGTARGQALGVDEAIDAIIREVQEIEAPAAAAFFRRVAGIWHLDYSKGHEDVRIDEDGNYFLIQSDKPELHLFTLENVVYDPQQNHVAFDKIDTGKFSPKHPKGHFRVRDEVEISVDGSRMQGCDSNNWALVYTRRP